MLRTTRLSLLHSRAAYCEPFSPSSSLSLSLSLLHGTHHQETVCCVSRTLRWATVNSLSSRCFGASPRAPTDLSSQPRTLHCHFRSLISYLHVNVQRKSGSRRLKQRWTASMGRASWRRGFSCCQKALSGAAALSQSKHSVRGRLDSWKASQKC